VNKMRKSTVCSKSATVLKDYHVNFKGGSNIGTNVVVAAGTIVTNRTAMGNDDGYRFPILNGPIAKTSGLAHTAALMHDLTHYGINVPAEYCSEWRRTECADP